MMFKWLEKLCSYGKKPIFTKDEVNTLITEWDKTYKELLYKETKGFIYTPSDFKEIESLTDLLDKYDLLKKDKEISIPLEYKSRAYKKYINQLVLERWEKIKYSDTQQHRRRYITPNKKYIKWYDVDYVYEE